MEFWREGTQPIGWVPFILDESVNPEHDAVPHVPESQLDAVKLRSGCLNRKMSRR